MTRARLFALCSAAKPPGRALLVLLFACAAGWPARAQQPDPGSRPVAPRGEERQPGLLAPAQTSLWPARRQDLPEAPSRLPQQARRITLGERFTLYRRSMINLDAAVSPAIGAAFSQGNNEPPEWGQGAGGFGRRLASGYGRLVINRSLRFGVAALDHEDPRFTPSNQRGFWRRFRQSSFDYVMPHTDVGTRIPAFSRFAGAYGAAFLANTWYPESRANTGHALMRGSTTLAASYAWHVFREFWPDIKKSLHHREREAREREPQPREPGLD